jgi:ABC-2 type transport system ATP-binding protein
VTARDLLTAMPPAGTVAADRREAEPVIVTEDLTRSFATGVAVDGLNLELRRGEVLALLGQNGAGKTTTVRMLNGVLRPDRGRALVLGLDPAVDGEEVRRLTGVLTENAGLDDRLTSKENLVFAARMRGFTKRAAASRADELLERFGMAERTHHRVQGFSTGQRKRLALARALVHEPELLFFDEPTSGLDPAATREVIALIGGLAAEGRTVVLCTHFLGEAGRLAHRMAILHRGRLQAAGRPEELAARLWDGTPATVELAEPASFAEIEAVVAVPGVLDAQPSAGGLTLHYQGRDALAEVVSTLVGRGVAVYAATPRPPTLEDVYFAVQGRLETETIR